MKARTIGGCLALLLGLGLGLPALAHSRATTKRVSVDSTGAQANRESFEPEISADGRYVAFESAASNLVADDTNGTPDVFVHDRSGSPQDQIEALAAIVQRLVDKGIPERGPRKGARGEAECCRKNPEEGNTTAACAQLAAFIRQGHALGLPHKDKDGQTLLAGAISLRKRLGCH